MAPSRIPARLAAKRHAYAPFWRNAMESTKFTAFPVGWKHHLIPSPSQIPLENPSLNRLKETPYNGSQSVLHELLHMRTALVQQGKITHRKQGEELLQRLWSRGQIQTLDLPNICLAIHLSACLPASQDAHTFKTALINRLLVLATAEITPKDRLKVLSALELVFSGPFDYDLTPFRKRIISFMSESMGNTLFLGGMDEANREFAQEWILFAHVNDLMDSPIFAGEKLEQCSLNKLFQISSLIKAENRRKIALPIVSRLSQAIFQRLPEFTPMLIPALGNVLFLFRNQIPLLKEFGEELVRLLPDTNCQEFSRAMYILCEPEIIQNLSLGSQKVAFEMFESRKEILEESHPSLFLFVQPLIDSVGKLSETKARECLTKLSSQRNTLHSTQHLECLLFILNKYPSLVQHLEKEHVSYLLSYRISGQYKMGGQPKRLVQLTELLLCSQTRFPELTLPFLNVLGEFCQQRKQLDWNSLFLLNRALRMIYDAETESKSESEEMKQCIRHLRKIDQEISSRLQMNTEIPLVYLMKVADYMHDNAGVPGEMNTTGLHALEQRILEAWKDIKPKQLPSLCSATIQAMRHQLVHGDQIVELVKEQKSSLSVPELLSVMIMFRPLSKQFTELIPELDYSVNQMLRSSTSSYQCLNILNKIGTVLVDSKIPYALRAKSLALVLTMMDSVQVSTLETRGLLTLSQFLLEQDKGCRKLHECIEHLIASISHSQLLNLLELIDRMPEKRVFKYLDQAKRCLRQSLHRVELDEIAAIVELYQKHNAMDSDLMQLFSEAVVLRSKATEAGN